MATSDKYKRGSSGYSVEDEKNAKRYGEMTRIEYQNLADRQAAGDKRIAGVVDSKSVRNAQKRATQNYLDNESSPQGRADNRSNLEFGQKEINKILTPNSRAQYEHEKEQGGPMTDLSYEEWKKL
jgi:hypothetical protein